MKKIFSLLLLASCMLNGAWAGKPTSTVVVLRPTNPGSQQRPQLRPLSDVDDGIVVYTSAEAVIVSSETVTDMVDVYVTDVYGSVVYSTTTNMAPGSEISISTENWEAGAYTLYINYNTTSLVGDFELE